MNLKVKEKLENEVKILQNILKKDIKLEKDKNYQSFFKENENNPIKIWKNIKNLINFKQKNKTEHKLFIHRWKKNINRSF